MQMAQQISKSPIINKLAKNLSCVLHRFRDRAFSYDCAEILTSHCQRFQISCAEWGWPYQGGNMWFMRIMRIITNMGMQLKISSTLTTYKYFTKMFIFLGKKWVKICNVAGENSFFKTLITLEPKVPHGSNASQNDHKSKGYLPVY